MKKAPGLPPPVRVNPVIKFCRWTLLLAGIYYGATKRRMYSRRETGIREMEAKRKAVQDAQLAKDKKIANEIELRELEKTFLQSS
ncbi:unnamed protein product [Tenebrio molitor]|jgi:F-type H+-transporting ATPase subunit e|nr:unnamed protein product [Tenebrio molitor]